MLQRIEELLELARTTFESTLASPTSTQEVPKDSEDLKDSMKIVERIQFIYVHASANGGIHNICNQSKVDGGLGVAEQVKVDVKLEVEEEEVFGRTLSD